MRRWICTLLWAGCSYALDGDRIGGDRRVGAYLDELTVEVCRCEEGDPKRICEARFRATTQEARDHCAIRWPSANACLREVRGGACPDPLRFATSCDRIFPECPSFFVRDTGFDSGVFRE
jgi:hypothetical protein